MKCRRTNLARTSTAFVAGVRFVLVFGCAVLALVGLAIGAIGLLEGGFITGIIGLASGGVWLLLAERVRLRRSVP